MSNLLTGIAPQAGLVAQSSAQTTSQVTRVNEGNAAALQQSQRAIVSGSLTSPAALVTISSGSQSRSASYGEGRSVDASFEKQELKEEKGGERTEGPKGRRSATVNVTA